MFPPNIGYPPPNTRLPADLILRFWQEVFDLLCRKHNLTPGDASAAVVRFRADADRTVGDMLYHRDASDVADTIAAGWKNQTDWTPAAPGRTGTTP